jgi:hypothetical protein
MHYGCVAGILSAGLGPASNSNSTGTVGVGTFVTIGGAPTAMPGICPLNVNASSSPYDS